MNAFVKNEISTDVELLASELREKREVRKISLSDVSKKIGIRVKYLEALERGNFSELPKGVYGKNFLREYALFLDISPEALIEIFEKNVPSENIRKENLFSNQVVKNRYFITIPRVLKNVGIIFLVMICFFYLGVSFKKIISPPNLVIFQPRENFVSKEKNIKVIGMTDVGTKVLINGDSILTNSEGEFTKSINLRKGVNRISIVAIKNYGPRKEEVRQILVE